MEWHSSHFLQLNEQKGWRIRNYQGKNKIIEKKNTHPVSRNEIIICKKIQRFTVQFLNAIHFLHRRGNPYCIIYGLRPSLLPLEVKAVKILTCGVYQGIRFAFMWTTIIRLGEYCRSHSGLHFLTLYDMWFLHNLDVM